MWVWVFGTLNLKADAVPIGLETIITIITCLIIIAYNSIAYLVVLRSVGTRTLFTAVLPLLIFPLHVGLVFCRFSTSVG